MPKLIPNLMKRLKHVPPIKLQHSPYPAPHIDHEMKTQALLPEDESPLLPEQSVKFIQSMVGATLCLSRIIDSTLLVGHNKLSMQQTIGTTMTLSLAKFMLDCVSSNLNPSTTYCKFDMQLWIFSDVSYLSVSKSRSRV